MKARRKIDELLQGYFRRSIISTLGLLFFCAAIFFIACWGHEVLESKRNAVAFVKTSEDRLLRLALDKNFEAIGLILADATAKSDSVSYKLEFTPQSQALPLVVGGETLAFVVWSLKPQSLFKIGNIIEYAAFFASLLMILIYFHVTTRKYIRHHLVKPLEVISSITRSASQIEDLKKLQTVKTDIFEVDRIRKTIWGSARRMQHTEKRLRQVRVLNALDDIAAIYSHNIGSPLTTLFRILDSCPEIPKTKREEAEEEIGKIRQIVNQLLDKYKSAHSGEITSSFDTKQAPEFIPVLIHQVVEKKRWEYRERPDLFFRISSNLHSTFSFVNASEFQRVLSNLINNSAEAINGAGEIAITISSTETDRRIHIVIADTGIGMSKEILQNLGFKGSSFGKSGFGRGVGLGVYHATQTLKAWGGQLRYESQITQGTKAIVTLPICQAPLTHPESIVLSNRTQLILIDDDANQANVWNALILEKTGLQGNVKQFTNPDDFREWFLKQGGRCEECLFIVDFEFADIKETGLDLIRQLDLAGLSTGLSNGTILVTGLAHDEKIRRQCEELGISLLMKGSQNFLAIEKSLESEAM